jgi:hypothetical protein
MPTCLECGEWIERGIHCPKHRLDSGSTLGHDIDGDDDLPGKRRGPYRDGGEDKGPEKRDKGRDRGGPVYRGE